MTGAGPVELRYGERDDQVLTMYAGGGASTSLVVAVHGGAWYTGDRSLMETTGEGLSARGLAVAAIAYRQRAADPVTDMIDDIRDAMRWARGTGAERVVLLGDSAGAHAAALHALRSSGTPEAPDLLVTLCGALSLDALRRPRGAEQEARFPGYVATLTAGGAHPERLERDDPLAARRRLRGAPPPLFAATSAYDFFAGSTRDYVDEALSRGDDVTLYYCGSAQTECTHSWQLDAELPATAHLFDLVAAWVGRMPAVAVAAEEG
jgi:acetyl esterase/lipase